MGALAAKGHFLWRHQRFSSLERSPFALQCYQGYRKPVTAGPEVQRRFFGRFPQKRKKTSIHNVLKVEGLDGALVFV